ncbi:TetR/AcrR family transcriptional regulator [Micromonospora purpureochromogenes]|uniref:TetR/AcrR family transcriptional regulator n=1 Tax=Micromonospora purpureochromogenes TaxID=47872 RepID=UPI0033C534AA
MTGSRGERRRRANGEESRRRILDAAAEVAGERGYEGTSIALVSEKCGLPASSIYWHFKNKDDLIAAVIERSFDIWVDVLALPGDDSEPMPERLAAMAVKVARTLRDSPDFLRLGLMLTLERRPEEPSARRVFLQVRETARARLAAVLARAAPDADRDTIETITTYAIAATDGLFIAKEIGGDSVDLLRLFELLGRTLYDSLTRLTGSSPATEAP